MKIAFPQSLGLILSAGLCLAAPVFGATLEFTGGVPNGAVAGTDIGASPYTMSLNGGSTVSMDCDDFVDNIDADEVWTVSATDLSTIDGESSLNTTVHFDNAAPATIQGQQLAYTMAAYLAIQLNNGGLTSAQVTDDSLALWAIFSPLTSSSDGYVLGNLVTANASGVASALLAATNAASAGLSNGLLDGYDVTIYTPTPSGMASVTSCPSKPCGMPQEFISTTYVPEPSTLAVLGFDVVGAGLVGLYFRRRNSRAKS